MTGIIVWTLLVGFFAGGNVAIIGKDMKYRNKVDNISIIGAVCGCLASLLIIGLAFAGAFDTIKF